MGALVLLALTLGGCSELSHEQSTLNYQNRKGTDLEQESGKGAIEEHRPCVGGYRADRISGVIARTCHDLHGFR